MYSVRKSFAGLVFLVLGCVAVADTAVIVLTKPGGAAKSSLDLAGLRTGLGPHTAEFRNVLKSDLERSGWFVMAPGGPASVVVDGSCEEGGPSLRVDCRVTLIPSRRICLEKSFAKTGTAYRELAHAVADEIVQAVKGCPGMASGRIAMVGARSGSKEIYVCDSDGQNLAQITDDKSISISPAWYPGGRRLAYTSFRAAFPYIYSIDLGGGALTREQLTRFPGMNMGAAISPDSRRMAMCLSKDGNPELYVMDLQSKRLARLTRTTSAGEASPSWSPDGRQIVFVSDSPGRPQLFVANSDGSSPRRLTRRGSENVAPDWGRNGMIAYTSLRDGHYQICVINPQTGQDDTLTSDGADYEDPSWAPDGRHIVCSRSAGHRSDVYILDTMGDGLIRLLNTSGDWRSPVWSSK
ncbi:MAG: DPP IV N-terminal domain-containing protein [bacterium]